MLSALRSARFIRRLIGSRIDFADCSIGFPINPEGSGVLRRLKVPMVAVQVERQRASCDADRERMIHRLEAEHRQCIEALQQRHAGALEAGLAEERRACAAACEAAEATQERRLNEAHCAAVSIIQAQHEEALEEARQLQNSRAARAVAGLRDQQAAAGAAARAEMAAQAAAHQAMADATAASFQVSK